MQGLPSPCLDICKYKLRGHCIACGMTKMQKRHYDGLRDMQAQRDFLTELLAQQARVGSARTWPSEYARKCERHGIVPPVTLSEG